MSEQITMRTPFPAHQISKLPKPSKKQTDEVRANFKTGIRCKLCGAWHHPDVVHRDYVGHAALTDRLLDVDPNWQWEPLALTPEGLPRIDSDGGMWIRLTVNGVTRLGYGDAQGKEGGDAMKERIGDALRNAAMRFGAALDLWHKGDLHIEEKQVEQPPAETTTEQPSKPARKKEPHRDDVVDNPHAIRTPTVEGGPSLSDCLDNISLADTLDDLKLLYADALKLYPGSKREIVAAKDARKLTLINATEGDVA